MDGREISVRLAYFFSEINALPPFREGKGRCQREFIRTLALHAGYVINFVLEHLIQQVRQKGGQKIVLWVIKDNANGRRFYETHGFINTGKTCIIEGTTKEDCLYEYVLK